MFMLSGESAVVITFRIFSWIVPLCFVVLSIVTVSMYARWKRTSSPDRPRLVTTGRFPTAMILCSIIVPLVYLGAQIGLLVHSFSEASAHGSVFMSDSTTVLVVMIHFVYAILISAMFLFLRRIYIYKNSKGDD